MKPLAIASVLLALLAPFAARADARSHRLELAGVALTSAGAVLTVGGVIMVSYFTLNPPGPDVSHGPCGNNCAASGPTNEPLAGGAATLAVGAVALGTGIALLVVGKRHEHASIALGAGALHVRF